MTKTHTPGPLAVAEGPDQKVYVVVPQIGVGAVLLMVPRQPRGEQIVAVVSGPTYEEKKATATLFASAPDLLAALKECVAVLKDLPQGHSEARIVALNAARAAIQKAEGKP